MYSTTRDWTMHRPTEHTNGEEGVSVDLAGVEDGELVARIANAYQGAIPTDLGSRDSFWFGSFEEMKRPIHRALVVDDGSLAAILRDPSSNILFYGFESLVLDGVGASPKTIYDNLLRVAEAVGALPLTNFLGICSR